MSVICQRCKEVKATVHITDTMPQQRERHLCEACAEKEGVIQKQLHQTTNEILQQFIKHKTSTVSGSDTICDKCGISFREFHVKGLLGCPHDYQVFRKYLAPLIERAHEGATQHVGKVPPSAGKHTQRQLGLVRLRRELKDALEQENYEQAASVRDQIRQLETPESS